MAEKNYDLQPELRAVNELHFLERRRTFWTCFEPKKAFKP